MRRGDLDVFTYTDFLTVTLRGIPASESFVNMLTKQLSPLIERITGIPIPILKQFDFDLSVTSTNPIEYKGSYYFEALIRDAHAVTYSLWVNMQSPIAVSFVCNIEEYEDQIRLSICDDLPLDLKKKVFGYLLEMEKQYGNVPYDFHKVYLKEITQNTCQDWIEWIKGSIVPAQTVPQIKSRLGFDYTIYQTSWPNVTFVLLGTSKDPPAKAIQNAYEAFDGLYERKRQHPHYISEVLCDSNGRYTFTIDFGSCHPRAIQHFLEQIDKRMVVSQAILK